uniref:Homeobox domain-containing protein n=1 Tax=Opuntia streptacantha TaxID=393608 RepID=A0A7C9AXN8_OPUST
MAAYFHAHGATEIPATGDHGALHTLILMNPNLAGAGAYSDSHAPQPPHHPPPTPSHNILLLNSAATAAALSHHPPPLHYPHNPQFGRALPQQDTITLYGYPPPDARDVTRRLHLSLSSENPPPYGPQGVLSAEPGREADLLPAGGGQSSVLGSKYLKATQELLEEVVHVGDGIIPKSSSESPKKPAGSGKGPAESTSEEEKLGGGGGGGAQLSTAERQEIQMKKAKLVTMLDEAEQRYRQYHHQMQIVIASFEQAAGVGSARTYTSLALKTISKQFRCLKDAIQGQIRAANRSLGEEEAGGSGVKLEGSRLKYIDHQIRQQRALQQLGMIQNHNAWRPQRGLPERSVSVLRAWLFEHFLHPYPKDSDKIMLAKQTGLTRSQVSNWFINARVRLWKPMIEEMYAEEMKEHEQEQNATEEKTSSKENNHQGHQAASNSPTDQNREARVIKNGTKDPNPTSSSSPPSLMSIPVNSTAPPQSFQHGFGLTDMEGISQGSPKRQRNDEILIKFGVDQQKQGRESNGYHPIISGGMNFVGGEWFGTEEFPPQARFLPPGNGNGISLSLGLPPSDHHQHMDLSGPNHTFLNPAQNMQFRRPSDFSSPTSHSSAAAFECIDIQNRKGFAAQLLPDFVA